MSPTEQYVLERILRFEIHADWQTLDVHYYHRGRKQWAKKVPGQHDKSGRWRFRFGPARGTVYRNRLMWMYFNRRAVPEGYVVDHRDGDCQNDSPDNLGLMGVLESYAQGSRVQKDKVLEELGDYFLTCGFLGYDPHELP